MVDQRRRFFLRGQVRPAATASERPRPPWAIHPDTAFLARCTRCGDCVDVCPEKVLKRADGGFPEIDFSQAGCTRCGDCSRACATGAIGHPEAGVAFAWKVSVSDACLNRQFVECRLCGDACDDRALRFVPARGGISQLQISEDACSGCGACVGVCPVKAISLR